MESTYSLVKKALKIKKRSFKWLAEKLNMSAQGLTRSLKDDAITLKKYRELVTILNISGKDLSKNIYDDKPSNKVEYLEVIDPYERILKEIKAQGLTISYVADFIGISQQSLSRTLKDRNLTLAKYTAICESLYIDPFIIRESIEDLVARRLLEFRKSNMDSDMVFQFAHRITDLIKQNHLI